MKTLIAYCGLDCETCEARLATINNNDSLRANGILSKTRRNNWQQSIRAQKLKRLNRETK